jgi:outer membrane protein TolC
VAAGSSGVLAPGSVPLTLEEAKQRTLANSKALNMAQMLVQEKEHATCVSQSYYYPQLSADYAYVHLDSFLGSVLTPNVRIHGRTVFTGTPISVPVFNQDQRYAALTVAQPITALLKVRQGVRIARADERIAAIGVEKARRELEKGVEDLYFGLLAARRIQAGAQLATTAAEKMATASGAAQARLTALQARQGLQAANKEVADLTEQFNGLLGLPLCTELVLAEPGPVVAPVACADEAIGLALGVSPDIQEARETIEKASAGVRVAKLDYMPQLNLLGFSAAQDGIPSIQHGFSGVALVGSVPLFEGGRRRHTVRQRETLLALAHEKLRDTEDKVRLEAQKAYREFMESGTALTTASDALALYKQVLKEAKTPAEQKAAVEAEMKAEVDYVKAILAQRLAYAKLKALIGKP